MQPQLPQNLEVRGEDAISNAGPGDKPVLALDGKYNKDWWLFHFGIFVEADDNYSGVTAYKVWRLRENRPVFIMAYGETVGALWATLQEMLSRAL